MIDIQLTIQGACFDNRFSMWIAMESITMGLAWQQMQPKYFAIATFGSVCKEIKT